MIVVLIVLLVAGGFASVRGGSWSRLAEHRFAAAPLLFAALAAQLLVDLVPLDLPRWASLAVVLGATLATLVFLLLNRSLPGIWPAVAGLGLNFLVISANGAMPVSAAAARTAGIESWLADPGVKHERASDDTVLPWLGDVIPLPGMKQVISVGDVILAVGIGQLVYGVMTNGSRGPRPENSASSREGVRGGGI